MSRSSLARFSAAVLGLMSSLATAQEYPVQPIKLLVAAAPGSVVDTLARLIGENLGPLWKTAFVVENIAGAGGLIATKQVSRATPDGYTLGLVASNFTVTPSLVKDSYDVAKDFTAISMLATTPMVMFVDAKLPVSNLQDFLKHARASSSPLTYASAGLGSMAHLAGELTKNVGGVELTHVPYNSLPQGMQDVMNGRVSAFFAASLVGMPQVEAGSLKAIGVTSAKRASGTPSIPTFAEQGLSGYELNAWFAMIGPPSLPQGVMNKLAEGLQQMRSDTRILKLMADLGLEPVWGKPDEFRALLTREVVTWADLLKKAGIEQR